MIERNRLLGLEAIRFLAACGVLAVHYHHFYHIVPNAVGRGITIYPFYYSFPFLYALAGEWAVQTFWCLSGFIFFWKYQESISSKTIGFKDFFLLRFARLYPLHLLTLILVAIGQAVYWHMTGSYFLKSLISVPHFVANLMMAGNRLFMPGSFNFPIWSVSIEVLVYFIFYFISRFFTTSIRFNIFIVLVFCLASWYHMQGGNLRGFPSLLECLLFFYTGGMAATLKKRFDLNNFSCHFGWIGVVLIPFVFWKTGAFHSDNTIFLFLAVWLPIVMFSASGDYQVSRRIRGAIETLGNLTYASYLIHIPFQLLIAVICLHWHIHLPLKSKFFLAGYMAAVFSLSYFIYRYFEMPMKRMIIDKFRNK